MDNSEEWRHECECRCVARWMWHRSDGADKYLADVATKRGKEAADRLRDRAREIVREHRKGV